MEVAELEISFKRPDVFYLFPIGDLHLGTKHCAEKAVRDKIAEIRELKNAYWVGMGDMAECITPSDKRWDIKVISDWVEPDNISHCQERKVVELLEPIKHKCLGLLEGNHEDSIRIHNHDDIQKNICEALSVKNLSYSCYYRLIFRRGKGHSHYSVVCMFTHGNGAPRTKGARMMNLLATMNEFEADLYAKGHLHDIITYPRPYLKLGLKNKIIESHRVGAITGSWVRSYKQNVPASYAEKAGYPPSAVGCPVFKIDPDERTLSVEG